MKNIAIIGAGASGLLLSRILSDDAAVQVYVFEKCKNVGTKLRASGGGKANIFNTNVTPDYYNHPEFIDLLLQKITPVDLQRTFEQMGMPIVADEEGRAYPATQFSQTVVDVLWTPERDNVHVSLEYEVRNLVPYKGRWRIDNCPTIFDHVVIATGTPANMIPKNRQQYNGFLTSFNLKTLPLQPSLVGFKIAHYPQKLSGCRTKVIAALYQGDRLIHREAGEVIFKDDGISGIVILNLSAYYNRLPNKANCHIELNLMYHNEQYDVANHLQKFGTLKGILHPKLNELYEQHPFDVKKFKLEIAEPYDLEYAQVCHGGIDLSEVNEDFSLKRYPEIFVTGELLDIDGVCGGYNLFFAFASAMVVARRIFSIF